MILPNLKSIIDKDSTNFLVYKAKNNFDVLYKFCRELINEINELKKNDKKFKRDITILKNELNRKVDR